MIEIFANRKEILESLSPLTGANQIVALIAKPSADMRFVSHEKDKNRRKVRI